MKNQDANRQALRSLQQALRAGRVIGLVGAGSSVRAGYPTWNGLLERMERSIQQGEPLLAGIVAQLKKEDDVLWRTQEYRRLLGDSYGSLLRETFGADGRLREFHKKLVKLPLRHILTTNYDPILERAHTAVWGEAARWIHWEDAWDLREFILRSGDPSYARRYVYLHGRFNKPDSIILTEQDYQDRYVLSDRDGDRIAALLATQQVLSIGFSLSDFDVMELFRQVKARTGPGRPHHYALLPLGPDQEPGLYRRRLNGKFGVEPVFYDWSPEHAGLDKLLDNLSDSRAPETRAELSWRQPKEEKPSSRSQRPDRAVPTESEAGPLAQEDAIGTSASGAETPQPIRESFAVPIKPEPSTAPSLAPHTSSDPSPLRIFASYSEKDSDFLSQLKKQFEQTDTSGLRVSWTDRPIRAGTEWDQDLFDRVERADLILLFVTPSLLASDYVYHAELKRALERQENGEAQVIPILLRPADWKSAPFAKLQALPRDGKPIAGREDADEAWQQIAAELQSLLAEGL